jgi:hypothetical protein
MKKSFRLKAFTSLTLLFSFVVLLVSGIILFASPVWDVAYKINWYFLGMNKLEWVAVHSSFSVLFIIVALVHILNYNWKALAHYIKSKKKEHNNPVWELILAAALTLLMIAGSWLEIPPFTWLLELSQWFEGLWT